MQAIRQFLAMVPWLDTLLKAGHIPLAPSTERNLAEIGGARPFEQVGHELGVHPALLWGVARAESNFDRHAVGAAPWYAKGLMQLIPANLDRYNVGDWRDPVQNVRGGARDLIAKGIKTDKELGAVLADYSGHGPDSDPSGYINDVTRFATWAWLREGVGADFGLELTREGAGP